MEKIKNLLKHKYVIVYSFLLVIFIIFLIVILFSSKKITKFERARITQFNMEISNYIDEVIDAQDDGKYINFAIEYLYNNTNKKEYSIDDIKNTINNYFDVDYDENKILNVGITKSMLDKGIVYDSGDKVFKYNNKKTGADIIDTEIVKYNLKNIKKINNNKFEIVIEKYVVENPLKILNYYNEQNNSKDDDFYDTKDIQDYIKGNNKVKVVKDAINEDNIKEIGKIDKTKKMTLIIKKDKLLINK